MRKCKAAITLLQKRFASGKYTSRTLNQCVIPDVGCQYTLVGTVYVEL